MKTEKKEFTLEFLKKNVYNRLKRKIITLTLQAEFNTFMSLLKDAKAMRAFMVREMHGICAVYAVKEKENLLKNGFFLIFPKKKTNIQKLMNFFKIISSLIISLLIIMFTKEK